MICLICYVIDRLGLNQWCDFQMLCQILEYWCELNSLGKFQFFGNMQLVLDGKVYNLQEFGELFRNFMLQ